jgi:CYTH domain-containing protein
LVTSADGA